MGSTPASQVGIQLLPLTPLSPIRAALHFAGRQMGSRLRLNRLGLGTTTLCLFNWSWGDRFYIIGCYIPPGDLTALAHVRKVWESCPRRCKPILLGDLNINLEYPWDERDETIAEQCVAMNLVEMTSHFIQPPVRELAQGRWTWQMRRGYCWVSSHPDYFLARR